MKRKYYKKYEITPCSPTTVECEKPQSKGFFQLGKIGSFELEDILILVLIFVMITEEEPDYLTIIALGFLLLS